MVRNELQSAWWLNLANTAASLLQPVREEETAQDYFTRRDGWFSHAT